MKKFTYEPEEKVVSTEIEERIRHIKNITNTSKGFKRENAGKLIYWLLESYLAKKMRSHYT